MEVFVVVVVLVIVLIIVSRRSNVRGRSRRTRQKKTEDSTEIVASCVSSEPATCGRSSAPVATTGK
jgi:hypothetical protein